MVKYPQHINYQNYLHKKQPTNSSTTHIQHKEYYTINTSLKGNLTLLSYKFVSIDLYNMYLKNPVIETRHILNNIIKFNQLDSHTNKELLTWYNTITKQNYFTNQNKTVIQNYRLAKGAPSSGILSEIFLQ